MSRPRNYDDLPVSRIVGGNIAVMRAARGWSQRTLADRTKGGEGKPVGFSTICRIEKTREPGTSPVAVCVDDLVALAAAFGVRPEQLLDEPKCHACMDAPPAGFTCNACGTAGGAA
jgi:transcriptional regulator with XRE-family HTH domain